MRPDPGIVQMYRDDFGMSDPEIAGELGCDVGDLQEPERRGVPSGSCHVRERETRAGTRYQVRFRTGGRDTPLRSAGTFDTPKEAELRRAAVARTLAAGRDPAVDGLEAAEPLELASSEHKPPPPEPPREELLRMADRGRGPRPEPPPIRYSEIEVKPFRVKDIGSTDDRYDGLHVPLEEGESKRGPGGGSSMNRGPKRRTPHEFRTAAGRRLLAPGVDTEEERRLMAQLESFAETDKLERAMEAGGRNARLAPKSAGLSMSRGGKLLRLAEAMARLRDLEWWSMSKKQRGSFLTLAEFALDALEVVEDDEVRIRDVARAQDRMDARLS